jgi:GGDEF domain-containing protein
MSVNDFYQSSTSANMRLQKLATSPAPPDLLFALEQANKNPTATIELPWKANNNNATFVLRVNVSDGSEEGPQWTLYLGDNQDAKVLWSHDSTEPIVILSLIAAETDPQRALNTFVDTSKAIALTEAPAWRAQPQEAQAAPSSVRVDLPAPAELDKTQLDAFQQLMRRPETGLTTEGGFYWNLIQEFNRYQRANVPVSLILFELAINMGDGKLSLPPLRVLHEATNRIQQNARNLDVLCHYKDPTLAMLLPHTGTREAVSLAGRLEATLLQAPLAPALDSKNIFLRFGVAGIPDTCDHPAIMISAALKSLEQAKATANSIVLFPSA